MENALSLVSDPAAWVALISLIAMELVLGIDNLVFISILSNKLEPNKRVLARRIGIGLALVLRLGLLASIAWIVQLTEPILTLFEHDFSWRDIILMAGGLFLLYKATSEIHHNVDHDEQEEADAKSILHISLASAVGQIVLLDLVFSIDSIITAVGMTEHVVIMFIAVIVAVSAMLLASGPLSSFIEKHPTVVMLALSFLFMIGMTLIADGFGFHVPKGYIYAAMAFSTAVEALNIFARRKRGKA